MSSVKIQPIKKFSKRLKCMPDKSITHRAVMFNAAAEGTGEVRGILLGEDCLSTADCMRRMGAQIDIKGDTAFIKGAGGFKSAELYCGNSGTTMRLLCGLLASQNGEWALSGDESLSRRPMNRVIVPLSQMGAKIASHNGRAPLSVTGGRLKAIDYVMPVASAQVKSAVLLAALGADGITTVTECEPTRDHTEIMLGCMGAELARRGKTIKLRGGQKLHGASIQVAGDISSAAFPLVCGLMTGGTVCVENAGLNPTRTGILEIFEQIGAEYDIENVKTCGGEKTGTLTVRGLGHGRGFKIDRQMLPRLVDEIPVLAVLACVLGGESVITGAEELRVKESDRIAATLSLVRSFGGCAEETESGMIISPVGKLKGGCVFNPCGDHRMAMAAGVAAAASENGATVENGECADVSYPGFWEMLNGR